MAGLAPAISSCCFPAVKMPDTWPGIIIADLQYR
jgi:hypothetical protein